MQKSIKQLWLMLVMAMVQIEQKAAVVNCTRQTAMPGNEVRQTGTAPSQLSMDEVLLFRRGRASPRQCNQLGMAWLSLRPRAFFSQRKSTGRLIWDSNPGLLQRAQWVEAITLPQHCRRRRCNLSYLYSRFNVPSK